MITLTINGKPRQVDAPAEKGEALATGYSCRSQVKRQSDQALRHPLQVLLEVQRR